MFALLAVLQLQSHVALTRSELEMTVNNEIYKLKTAVRSPNHLLKVRDVKFKTVAVEIEVAPAYTTFDPLTCAPVHHPRVTKRVPYYYAFILHETVDK